MKSLENTKRKRGSGTRKKIYQDRKCDPSGLLNKVYHQPTL